MAAKRNRNSFNRKRYFKEPNLYFLIICEGEKTEPNYFSAFKVNKEILKVEIEGLGANTDSLVQRADNLKRIKERERNIKFDSIWCVFDRDSFTAQNFNRAIQLAQNKGFRVAYSNESFGLWYLLHFEFLDAGISRVQYIEKLNEHLGKKYEKNLKDIYQQLKPLQTEAIKNAKTLLSRYTPPDPEKDKPSTTVYLLVEELNKYLL